MEGNKIRKRTVIYDIPDETEKKIRMMAASKGQSFQEFMREVLEAITEAGCEDEGGNTIVKGSFITNL